jgi:hypothetical protein
MREDEGLEQKSEQKQGRKTEESCELATRGGGFPYARSCFALLTEAVGKACCGGSVRHGGEFQVRGL